MKSQPFLQTEAVIFSKNTPSPLPPPILPPKEDAEDHDLFISLTGVLYVIVNSWKDKGKALKEHILKDLVSRGFDARTEDIQEDHQQTFEELNNQIQAIQYKNIDLQGEIRAKDQELVALQRRHNGYLSNEDKSNGLTIIAKNSETSEYPYISICGQHGYRRHKTRVLLACNQGSTLFANGDMPNAIVTYYFWRELRLIIVGPNRLRYLRLEVINRGQLLILNNTLKILLSWPFWIVKKGNSTVCQWKLRVL